jgi:hypothetical protein
MGRTHPGEGVENLLYGISGVRHSGGADLDFAVSAVIERVPEHVMSKRRQNKHAGVITRLSPLWAAR